VSEILANINIFASFAILFTKTVDQNFVIKHEDRMLMFCVMDI